MTLDGNTRNTASGSQTHARARVVRELLEHLDDLKASRAEIVGQAQQLQAADDVQPQIARKATGLGLWAEVKAADFEDLIGAELLKYERFHEELESGRDKQADLLERIKVGWIPSWHQNVANAVYSFRRQMRRF